MIRRPYYYEYQKSKNVEENNKVAKDSIALFMNKVIREYHELKLTDDEFKKRLLIYIEDENRQIQKISTFDENGKEFTIRVREDMAVAFQHELDHLDGILFVDKIDKKNPYKNSDIMREI